MHSEASIFWGSQGLRAIWRVLLFTTLAVCFGWVAGIITAHLLGTSATKATANSAPDILKGEFPALIVMFLVLFLLARLDRIKIADYGLPLSRGFLLRFLIGAVSGLTALSLLIGFTALFHGVDLGTIAGSPAFLSKEAVLFAIAFICVGFFEELMMRSYLMFACTRGMGFWAAATFTSALFALVHLGNSGETWYGLSAVFAVGMLFCLFLRRTGDLWLPIGFHFAWDWAETYFYGTPDSGTRATGSLFHANFHGANWITGGTVGPEGSAFCFVVIAISALVFALVFRENRYHPERIVVYGT